MSSQKKKRFKKLVQPQEVIVWYILPAIRRAITNSLIEDHHLPQKDIAQRFGLTEPAISQYKKGARGDIDFNPDIVNKIRGAARNIAEEGRSAPHEVQRVLQYIQNGGFLCEFHRKYGMVHEGCDICKT
ncbi:MAG: transcriptional regulator [Candidatus Heimdallarchaeota archaeon]|nr:MAG: transcriptional regulator [Candidatus Heimdallarchaeota archaeon]